MCLIFKSLLKFFPFFFLVHHQKSIEKQLGIRIIDSGIGNPTRVRDRYRLIHEYIRNII
jgi:hypothetical protein